MLPPGAPPSARGPGEEGLGPFCSDGSHRGRLPRLRLRDSVVPSVAWRPGEGQPCRAGAVPTVDPAFSALTGGGGGDGAGRPPRDPSLSPGGQARPGCARTRAQCRVPAPRSHRLRLGPSSPSQQDFDVNRTRANKQSLWPPVSASPDLMATPPVPPGPGLWVPGSVSHSLHRPRASVQALSPVSRGGGGGASFAREVLPFIQR